MFRTVCLGLSLSFASVSYAQARPAPDGFVELTQRLSPSVVNISTAQTVELSDEDMPQFEEGSPLERFNDFFGNRPGRDGRVSKSLGSGFVIDGDGHIVTNNHVIEGADLIEVTFPNGDTFEAALVGRDPATDIAVLKIDASDIPFVSFGDSDAAQVGEWVIAIGNPLGYSGSVTAGIISARNRNISAGNYDDFIQTDVAINQGNSGGPLFNMDGEVIGVNTAIISPTGYSIGLSFSVPSDLADSVSQQLIEFGETRRGYLGVRTQAVTPDIARAYGLDEARGAIIQSVVEDGPAEAAGLRRQDLILRLGDREIEDTRTFFRAVAETPFDTDVEVEYIRKRKRVTGTVRLTRLAETLSDEERLQLEVDSGNAERTVGGLSVEALTDDVRRDNRVRPDVNGVRVVSIDRRSRASGKILKGDIIEEVDFEAVATPVEFEDRLAAALGEGRPVTLLINRGGNAIIFALTD